MSEISTEADADADAPAAGRTAFTANVEFGGEEVQPYSGKFRKFQDLSQDSARSGADLC